MRLTKKLIYISCTALLILIITVAVFIYNANKIIKYELERFLGRQFSVESIDIHWGSVSAENISLIRPDGKHALNINRLDIKADFTGLIKRQNNISEIEINNPVLFLEINRYGNLIFPFIKEESKNKNITSGRKPPPFFIKRLSIRNGSFDYLDRKVAGKPVLIGFRNLNLTMKDFTVPVTDRVSEYRLISSLKGRHGDGVLKANGIFNLKTKDTQTRLSIRDFDITELKPYYQKKGDVEVTKGKISVDADINILNYRIQTTGKIYIKDLEFNTEKGRFLGMPLIAIVKLMKDSSGSIMLDFTIEGDLKNPKFNIRDSLVRKVSLSLVRLLGLPVEKIGKSVIEFGGSALKNIFK